MICHGVIQQSCIWSRVPSKRNMTLYIPSKFQEEHNLILGTALSTCCNISYISTYIATLVTISYFQKCMAPQIQGQTLGTCCCSINYISTCIHTYFQKFHHRCCTQTCYYGVRFFVGKLPGYKKSVDVMIVV